MADGIAPLASGTAAPVPCTVRIAPSHGLAALRLPELWEYRELLYFLVWRDVKVRYKQTALGATWAVAQPLFSVAVFSLFFGGLAKIPSDGIPYPLWSLAGVLPWTYFSQALTKISSSLVGNANLIKKVYFPRLVIPLGSVFAGLLDLGIALVVLAGLMVYYRHAPGWPLALVPAFILLAMATALAAGLWFAAINVEYRDVGYVISFLVQFWMFATPVVYPSTLIPERWRVIYGLNPMAGVVEGFRWAFLGTAPPGPMLAVSIGMTCLVLVSGLMYFRRMERDFADVV